MAKLTGIVQNAVITASGNSGSVLVEDVLDLEENAPNLNVLLVVSAVSGTTPSLTVEVQWSDDNVNFASAQTPDVFTAITAVGNVVQTFNCRGQYARLKYTVSGTTPSFTLTAFALA